MVSLTAEGIPGREAEESRAPRESGHEGGP